MGGDVIVSASALAAARVERAKQAYTTRRVALDRTGDLDATGPPRSGDLVLARVIEVGQHARLELRTGRRARLFPGDEIVVCYGARYAPDQFEADVPGDLGPCQLVAAGGIAGRAVARHEAVGEPTEIEPVGLLAGPDGERLNVAGAALGPPPPSAARPAGIAVLGTSMNSGKTTGAAALVRGLGRAGRRVVAAKVTGTGAGGDAWLMRDAGAEIALDFTDAGLATTAGQPPEVVEGVFLRLTGHLAARRPDAFVIEVADGLRQRETAALVASPAFAAGIDGILFAASDALGAEAGVGALGRLGLPVIGVCGTLTRSPLAMREAQEATGLPILDLAALSDPARAAGILRGLGGVRARAALADTPRANASPAGA